MREPLQAGEKIESPRTGPAPGCLAPLGPAGVGALVDRLAAALGWERAEPGHGANGEAFEVPVTAGAGRGQGRRGVTPRRTTCAPGAQEPATLWETPTTGGIDAPAHTSPSRHGEAVGEPSL